MAEGDPSAAGEGIFMRVVRALELLLAAHARVAKMEARIDLSRILSSLFLIGFALGLLSIAVLLGQLVLAMAIEARFQCGYPSSLAAVAGVDLGIAVLLLVRARARLQSPVLVETRAMMKKAAAAVQMNAR